MCVIGFEPLCLCVSACVCVCCMCVCAHVCMQACVCLCVCVCTYAHVHMPVHMCMNTHACLYANVWMWTCLLILCLPTLSLPDARSIMTTTHGTFESSSSCIPLSNWLFIYMHQWQSPHQLRCGTSDHHIPQSAGPTSLHVHRQAIKTREGISNSKGNKPRQVSYTDSIKYLPVYVSSMYESNRKHLHRCMRHPHMEVKKKKKHT